MHLPLPSVHQKVFYLLLLHILRQTEDNQLMIYQIPFLFVQSAIFLVIDVLIPITYSICKFYFLVLYQKYSLFTNFSISFLHILTSCILSGCHCTHRTDASSFSIASIVPSDAFAVTLNPFAISFTA